MAFVMVAKAGLGLGITNLYCVTLYVKVECAAIDAQFQSSPLVYRTG